MADQMTTHQTAVAAAAAAPAQAEPGILPPLPEIPNPIDLKDISTLKLTDKNFREWKNLMLAEFGYYGTEKIINGTHDPPTTGTKLAHWQMTEQLFIRAFAASLPAYVYEDVKMKNTLREKWLAILRNYIHTDVGKSMTALFNIKLEATEKIMNFVIRL